MLKSPLVGNSIHESTRYRFHDSDSMVVVMGIGLTDFIAKFGLVGLALVVFLVQRGMASSQNQDLVLHHYLPPSLYFSAYVRDIF